MENFGIIISAFSLMGIGAALTIWIQDTVKFFEKRKEKRRKYEELSRKWESRG